jgi:acyl-CoA synthetase (AMP-forming)/AMP-acid ligase II
LPGGSGPRPSSCGELQFNEPDARQRGQRGIKPFVKQKLAYHKQPKRFLFLDAFPAVPSGKIQKFRLKEMAIEALGLQEAAAVETA